MNIIESLIANKVPSGVYVIESSDSIEAVERFVKDHKLCFFYLDGMQIRNGPEFYTKFGIMIGYGYGDFGAGGEMPDRLHDVLWDLETWGNICDDDISGYIIFYDYFDIWYQQEKRHDIIAIFQEMLNGPIISDDNSPDPFPRYLLIRGNKEMARYLNITLIP